MADTKISALTAIDAVAAADLLAIVDDPAGTPTSKKATAQQLATYVESTLGLGTMAGETAANYTPTASLGTMAFEETGDYAVTSRGLPTGGTDGQVLTKTSGTDYAVAWETPSGGGGGGSVDDTAYGASWNGVTDVAPSKNAVYDKIETMTIIASAVSDNWVVLGGYEIMAGTFSTAVGANRIYTYPFTVPVDQTITDVGVRIQAASASNNMQIAIYGAGSNGRPTGNVLASTGNISTATAAFVSAELSAPVALKAGTIYWAAINCSGTPAFAGQTGNSLFSSLIGASSAEGNVITSAAAYGAGLDSASTIFGTWPDATGNTWNPQTGSGRFAAIIGQIQ